MRTVKEISDLTGISVRTLHYYDEIGLLKPTKKSDAGCHYYESNEHSGGFRNRKCKPDSVQLE